MEENTAAGHGLQLLEHGDTTRGPLGGVDICLCQYTHIVMARSTIQGDREHARINLLFRSESETEQV